MGHIIKQAIMTKQRQGIKSWDIDSTIVILYDIITVEVYIISVEVFIQ